MNLTQVHCGVGMSLSPLCKCVAISQAETIQDQLNDVGFGRQEALIPCTESGKQNSLFATAMMKINK